MAELPPGRRGVPSAVLFVVRIVYAFNWYNIGAVLPLIALTLSASPAQLGIVLGTFLVGVGIFQVPAGLAAVRWGSRRVSLAGVAVFGAAGVATAFAPTWETLALLRFVGGVGAAFFFSPALSLIASYYPAGERGPVIGFYNGGFSVGGAIGLVVGAGIGLAIGWPAALGLGGVALLATTALAYFVIPRQPPEGSTRASAAVYAAGRAVLSSRSIWGLSLALTGFWTAIYLVAQDFVEYAHDVHPGWGTGVAAILTAVVVVSSFPGGPIGGWIAERGRDRRLLIGLVGAVVSGLVLLVPLASIWTIGPLFLALGFLDGVVFTILYLIPTYLPETQGEGLALGVGVVNSIQVLLGSGFVILFGVLVEQIGWTGAWLYAGLLSFALLPALFWVAPNRASVAPKDP
ncbi:MAG TPA: MFS transporter [Thermoplasmata archaeon]|nr:MFS transporter [Thermoplasmata archaeon]